MNDHTKKGKSAVERAGEDLFNFAINRDDIKTLLTLLPEEGACKPEAIEYELQILKIIAVGWAAAYFLGNSSGRHRLADTYWKSIHEFSETLSETTRLMTGRDINYFQILNERLNMYVASLEKQPETVEPAAAIGPEFARVCGNSDDVFAVMTGSRMFLMTVAGVKEFLETMNLR